MDADGARQPSAGRGREERNKSSVSEPRRQAARAVRGAAPVRREAIRLAWRLPYPEQEMTIEMTETTERHIRIIP